MNTFFPLIRRPWLLFGLLVLAASGPAWGQLYRRGDIVQNFTLTDRSTGQPVSLYDLEGKVIFLEWFAWWCPFCQAAASDIGPRIVDYYEESEGNPNGVEVVHVSLNLQAGQEGDTQAFINFYNLGTVWNDFNRTVARRFGSNQPIFAIINGVDASPSHAQWELIYSQNGYGQNSAPIQNFRNAINSVEAAEIPDIPPSILAPPATVAIPDGDTALFSIDASGDNLTFQWFKDGNPIVGATEASLEVASSGPDDAGAYRVEVVNSSGSEVSQTAFLSILPEDPVPVALGNVSTRLDVGSGAEILVAGFVLSAGDPGPVLVRGVGPALAEFGVSGILSDPRLSVYRANDEVAANDDWSMQADPSVVQARWQAAGAFDLMMDSKDGALYRELEAGPYTAQISGTDDGTGVGLAEVYHLGAGDTAQLVNISTRGRIVGDSAIMIMGFVLGGDTPRDVLIRAVGPTLGDFGVDGVVVDPELKLYRDADIVAENDQWSSIQADAKSAAAGLVGAFTLPADSADSAILIGLPPGRYTAHVSAKDAMEGIVLAEVYLLD